MVTGSGGPCLDGSMGSVPLGCSAQSGGDWAAHYKTSGVTGAGCVHEHYQLVCSNVPDPTPESNCCSPPETRHEVRCCSNVRIEGWSPPGSQLSACPVWAESDAWAGGCQHNRTFLEAASFCASVGGQLCTAAELTAGCGQGTGCEHDHDLLWSSTGHVELCTTGPTMPPTTSMPSQSPGGADVIQPDASGSDSDGDDAGTFALVPIVAGAAGAILLCAGIVIMIRRRRKPEPKSKLGKPRLERTVYVNDAFSAPAGQDGQEDELHEPIDRGAALRTAASVAVIAVAAAAAAAAAASGASDDVDAHDYENVDTVAKPPPASRSGGARRSGAKGQQPKAQPTPALDAHQYVLHGPESGHGDDRETQVPWAVTTRSAGAQSQDGDSDTGCLRVAGASDAAHGGQQRGSVVLRAAVPRGMLRQGGDGSTSRELLQVARPGRDRTHSASHQTWVPPLGKKATKTQRPGGGGGIKNRSERKGSEYCGFDDASHASGDGGISPLTSTTEPGVYDSTVC